MTGPMVLAHADADPDTFWSAYCGTVELLESMPRPWAVNAARSYLATGHPDVSRHADTGTRTGCREYLDTLAGAR